MKARRNTELALIEQLARLIAEGENILNQAIRIPPVYHRSGFAGESTEISPAYNKIDCSRYIEWRTEAVSILFFTIPERHPHFKMVEGLVALKGDESSLMGAIAFIKGIKSTLENGFLNELSARIEAEVAADYIGMAERILLQSSAEKFHHVSAAMLISAVLERGLKDLCLKQEPPITCLSEKGGHKTLNLLINDLKKAETISELKAKQLRAWADIRNAAAHGQFESFSVTEVEQMIQGVTHFLAEYS
jgi:hypothetical protein